MTITVAATVFAGFLAPFLTALANQFHWSATLKRAVAVTIAAILAGLVAVGSDQFGELIPHDWTVAVGKWFAIAIVVAGVGQSIFPLFKGILSALEAATTFAPRNTDGATNSGPVLTSEQPADAQSDAVAEDTSGTPPDAVDDGVTTG